mgnify:FL=1
MRVRKGNVVFDLKDKNQIDAFRNSEGWKIEGEGAVNSAPSNPTCEPEQQENKTQYSRSEIARMSTADLKEVAISLGLEVTEESTGKVLKEQILEKLGL